ncbi:MAG TPA: hypothetical protein VIT89_12315 [Solirubrobacterales bacterium]
MADAAAGDSERVDPDGSTYDVMAIYGALMLEVQVFEMNVAVLSLVAESDPERQSNASLRRQLDAAYRKSRHTFRRGSLSASRDRLKGRINEDLLAEVDEFLAHRNRLAHRFLIERMVVEGEPRFKGGTALEILEYARHFKATGRRIQKETERRTRDSPDAPGDIETLLERFAHSIMLGGDVTARELEESETRPSSAPDTDGRR